MQPKAVPSEIQCRDVLLIILFCEETRKPLLGSQWRRGSACNQSTFILATPA